MPSNIQENLPVAFAMLEKLPDRLRCYSFTSRTDVAESIIECLAV